LIASAKAWQEAEEERTALKKQASTKVSAKELTDQLESE